MGLFEPIAVALGNLALVLVDLTIALLLIRVLAQRFTNSILSAFDRVGAPIVEEVTRRVRVAMERSLGRTVSGKTALAGSLISLLLVRVAAVAVLKAMIAP
jgi:hypothetical protein